MTAKGKIIKIGFDLDGVIIDKPPLIPKRLIEWLYRGRTRKKLSYRFPNTKLEIWIRQLSHHPFLRPPIKRNLKSIRELSKDKKYKLCLISGRYSFLQEHTNHLLKKHRLEDVFDKVYLNKNDEQPHLFKQHKIKDLNLDYFVEDDFDIVEYLTPKVKTKIVWIYTNLDRFNLNPYLEKVLKDICK